MTGATAPINAITISQSLPIRTQFLPDGNCKIAHKTIRFHPISCGRAVKAAAPSLEDEIPPNARLRKEDSLWRGGFSLGVDLGSARTGLAISKGFVIRPLTVLELKGQKLELRLLDIAQSKEVDEFIIGLPVSIDGKETPQSNKVRSVAGRLAIRAAERGWRVYLQNEHGTSTEALHKMIDEGLNSADRHGRLDAYAAAMLLERYFTQSGGGVELVFPKQLDLQVKLRQFSARNV
ncbi:OLC1v1002130C1 [Oldenlandia corymbosa var. corymbosa]|uniref:OLC1v1002130C1 n=1 Tax=Oldenlandia corymbosa var. corymbosa TaxID=529605 RepID=A0AAV1D7K7_OLDCO|nr:OLC1v1002130C1 [Oldenlandia corymbosa var. corymbosa]